MFVLTSDITLKNILQQFDKTLNNYISCPFVSRLHGHLVQYEVSLLYPMNILEIHQTPVTCLMHNYNPAVLKSPNMRQSCYAMCCRVYIRCQINLTEIIDFTSILKQPCNFTKLKCKNKLVYRQTQ